MAGTVVKAIPRVFDRYMLPKVAFAVITGASIAGAILTGLRHGIGEYHLLALRWAATYTLALLLGAELWKIFYLRPSVAMRPLPNAVEYGEAMLLLHRRWQQRLTPLLLLLMSANLWSYTAKGPIATPWIAVAAMALTLAVIGLILSWQERPDAQHQDYPSWLALAGLGALAAAVGGLDVALQGGDKLWLLAPNRALHLWAFSAWLGGALWNIFIAVPAGLTRINMDTVILANFQLERFRVVVRAVFQIGRAHV